MGAFELHNREDEPRSQNYEHSKHHEGNNHHNILGENLDPKRLREETIIAFKVYDICRHLHINKIHQTIEQMVNLTIKLIFTVLFFVLA